ncbi:Rho guanine nucleotide exchange factor [Marasmius tenuissimus]|nr:Rho guanine nucleotide exchange factor [Marasmius tenuissimus]
MDLNTQIRRLEDVFHNKPKCRALDSRTGQNAKDSLNLLQLLIDYPGLSNRLRSKICSTMVHVSKKTGFHPKCLMIEKIEVVGEHPVDGGGYADIWRGRLGQSLVCLKILRIFKEPEIQQVVKDCMPEAVLWKQLKHPNVLPFLGIFLDTSRRPCLVSPWMENGNLTRYIRTANPSLFRRVLLAFDVASGLAYLHEKSIVHGDLKGVNVLLTPDLRACISDFGLSIVADSSLRFSSTSSTFPGGTTRYQAPEVVLCIIPGPTRESDIYSYGCVAYEIFSGRLPFHQVKQDVAVVTCVMRGERPTRPVDIPGFQSSDKLWTVIEQCWKAEPSERPSAVAIHGRLVEIESRLQEVPSTTQNGSEISRVLWENVYSPHLTGADVDTFISTLESKETFNQGSMLWHGSNGEPEDIQTGDSSDVPPIVVEAEDGTEMWVSAEDGQPRTLSPSALPFRLLSFQSPTLSPNLLSVPLPDEDHELNSGTPPSTCNTKVLSPDVCAYTPPLIHSSACSSRSDIAFPGTPHTEIRGRQRSLERQAHANPYGYGVRRRTSSAGSIPGIASDARRDMKRHRRMRSCGEDSGFSTSSGRSEVIEVPRSRVAVPPFGSIFIRRLRDAVLLNNVDDVT